MPRLTSTGTCALCGASVSKQAMTRHLQKCLPAQLAAARAKAKPQTTFHLLVESAEMPQYWLHLDVPVTATLSALDNFLRDLWLECCGHLSAFTINEVMYEVLPDPDEWFGPPSKSMKQKLVEVVAPGTVFGYEYDFGSTTYLKLKVLAERTGGRKGKGVWLLARNDAPVIKCAKCGQPAEWVCSYCTHLQAGWLCGKHVLKHKCGDEALLPVVNSPRVGVCAYTGPLED